MQESKKWKYFECQRCGKCCEETGLPYDPVKIHEIAKYLNISVEDVIQRYYGRLNEDGKTWDAEENKRTPCPFLKTTENKKVCSIYPARPDECACYPIDTDFGMCGVACPAGKIVLKNQG